MNTRQLGKTGLTVTPIGLGLAALGRPGYINIKHAEDLEQDYNVKNMEQHAHQVLDAAWQAGIRYFDAARSYGSSEAFLASWLATCRIRPGEVSVGSKWGYIYTADWRVDAPIHETKEHTLEVLRRQRQESDANLGQYLGLYQIHSATLESGVLENQAVLSELARYRDNGLVIGLTLSGPRQAETLLHAMKIIENGRPLFECVQATWNLLEQSSGEALKDAHERGMGIIIKEALANGRLTAKNDEPPFAQKRALLEEVAAEQKTTMDALALAAVLAQPWVDVVLSGAATREQLISNVAATHVVWNEQLSQRLAGIGEPPQEYWTKRGSLRWN
jgi:aryl-alcohol dehydrogenase-like predicted oxidoreductase